jgi:hypothetical protein
MDTRLAALLIVLLGIPILLIRKTILKFTMYPDTSSDSARYRVPFGTQSIMWTLLTKQ